MWIQEIDHEQKLGHITLKWHRDCPVAKVRNYEEFISVSCWERDGPCGKIFNIVPPVLTDGSLACSAAITLWQLALCYLEKLECWLDFHTQGLANWGTLGVTNAILAYSWGHGNWARVVGVGGRDGRGHVYQRVLKKKIDVGHS
jgi:hypothetical protein